jgi:hypothetical protein
LERASKIGSPNLLNLNGAPGMIRTCDPLIRSQVLYPTELRVRGGKYKWLEGNSKTRKK